MRFADPLACPRCRGAISGYPTCPHCRLDLTSAEIRELWQALLRADGLLAQATAAAARPAQSAPPAPSAAPSASEVRSAPSQPSGVAAPAAPSASGPLPLPAYPQASPAEPDRTAAPCWSVGTILLVVGAFGLIVASLIFVTRS